MKIGVVHGILAILGLIGALGVAEVSVRVVSRYSPTVSFLAHAGRGTDPGPFSSLEGYLRSKQPHIAPHREWLNFYTNALGFNDVEFVESRSSGRFRIMALGDSFIYGLVSYPLNVLTLLEKRLQELSGRAVELYNFGVPASGVWDYETLLTLAFPRFKPDLVLLHLYLGNDPPDLLHGFDDFPASRWSDRHSLAASFIGNAFRLLRLSETHGGSEATHRERDQLPAIGGGPVTSATISVESLPSYSREGYRRVLEDELGRMFEGGAAAERNERWGKVFDALRRMQAYLREHNASLVVVLFPSRLQLEADLFQLQRSRQPRPNQFRRAFPAEQLVNFCAASGLTCFDLTSELRGKARAAKESLYIERDTHWNARGNALAAEIEAAKIRPILEASGLGF